MTMTLKEFSRKGGQSRSPAKVAAARKNARKATSARVRAAKRKHAA